MNLPDQQSPDLLKIIALLLALALKVSAEVQVDPTFQSQLPTASNVRSLALNDHQLLAAQDSQANRWLPNGQPASSPDLNTDGWITAVAAGASHSYLAGRFTTLNGSATRGGIIRVHADGTLDSSWGPVFANGRVNFIQELAPGEVLLAGDFTTINGQTRTHVARLTPAGELDPYFIPQLNLSLAIEAGVSAAVLQPDGKLLIGGIFDSGNSSLFLARLNQDGSLDGSFQPAQTGYLYIHQLSLAHDGSILACGTASSDNRGFVYKLTASGAPAPAFTPLLASKPVHSVVELGNHTLLLAPFQLNGHSSPAALLSAQGALLDSQPFSLDGLINRFFAEADQIFAAGSFSQINGHPSPGIARLVSGQTQQGTNEHTLRTRLRGEPGRSYMLEVSDDLALWLDHGQAHADQNGEILVRESSTPKRERRFFRARLLQ